MQRAIVERNLVVVLFILVLVVFSFAERDTKKLDKLYSKYQSFELVKKQKNLAATSIGLKSSLLLGII